MSCSLRGAAGLRGLRTSLALPRADRRAVRLKAWLTTRARRLVLQPFRIRLPRSRAFWTERPWLTWVCAKHPFARSPTTSRCHTTLSPACCALSALARCARAHARMFVGMHLSLAHIDTDSFCLCPQAGSMEKQACKTTCSEAARTMLLRRSCAGASAVRARLRVATQRLASIPSNRNAKRK